MKAKLVLGYALLGVIGCSDLPTTGDGVVSLQIVNPASLALAESASVTLTARALDADGDEVAVAIAWSTPDTTIAVTDAGVVTALVASGTGRVQAAIGSLRSNLITFTLQPASGVLRAGP